MGFFADKKLKKVAVSGGDPIVICDADVLMPGGSWGANGEIILTLSGFLWSTLARVSSEGGTPQKIASPDLDVGEVAYTRPQVLPGDTGVLSELRTRSELQTVVYSEKTGQRRVVLRGGRGAKYLPTGHLAYVQSDTLMVAPFDLDRLEVSGAAVPVMHGIRVGMISQPDPGFDVSETGTLVFVTSPPENALVWADSAGNTELLTKSQPNEVFWYPRLSPDRSKIVATIGQAGEGMVDVWVYELARGTWNRLTFNGWSFGALWTPDGKCLLFAAEEEGELHIHSISAQGGGEEQELFAKGSVTPGSLSSDGRTLAYMQQSSIGYDIGVLDIGGEGSFSLLLDSPFNERQPRFSPDGAWMAYVSDESGRDEVYARPYPRFDEKWTISRNGGTEPVWSADGKFLFYRHGNAILSSPTESWLSSDNVAPKKIFEKPFDADPPGALHSYDVSPDGRFILASHAEEPSLVQINVVLNWFEELNRLVPTDN